jgi:hypothetical protein
MLQATLDSWRQLLEHSSPAGSRPKQRHPIEIERSDCDAFKAIYRGKEITITQAYDQKMPMREMGELFGFDNGWAEWAVLGAHGRRPDRAPRSSTWEPTARRIRRWIKHWTTYHPDQDIPRWITDLDQG